VYRGQTSTWALLVVVEPHLSRRLHPSCEVRDIFARQMPPAQTADAQRRAREWDAAHPREP